MKLTSSAKYSLVVINLILSGLVVNGCKPSSNSDVKSIDNFGNSSADKFTLNDCQPYAGEHLGLTIDSKDIANKWVNDSSRIEVRGGDMPAGVKEDLEATMGLVPAYILKPLYDQSTIKVYIMDNATEACNGIAKVNGAEPVDQPFNCWAQTQDYNGFIFANGKISQTKAVNVRQAIRHSLIRSMAYYYFHAILDTKQVPQDIRSLVDKLKSSNPSDMGRAMVDAFAKDLQAKGTSLKQLGLGDDSQDLRKAIFVESLDSEFCSSDTNKKFQADFPSLYKVYKGL